MIAVAKRYRFPFCLCNVIAKPSRQGGSRNRNRMIFRSTSSEPRLQKKKDPDCRYNNMDDKEDI